ncbi:site-2 protease family protein [Gleimia sp. 6138-11-ORH1]|uniref:M50 family metallopeptidase n=1 Tax=Gleimia sp. 6138-11-ORH1 TaxID=2973937 RepID=UPI00216945F7|nr:site-2 protease family protein [Gleimia sp. 6138-11-ORH1]MCS4484142.1 site-2 protease family protein [Gleimia sp. 6138-11-ORH1]
MYILGILLMVLGIVISVAIHELGHLLPAKKFGVYVPEYMVGFGPKLWSIKKGDTEYGIKAILLGGYVRLVGMFPPAKPGTKLVNRKGQQTLAEAARQDSQAEIPPGKEAQAFYRLKTWQKLVVMFGGPFTNLVLAIGGLSVVIMGIGLPQPVPTVRQTFTCLGTTETTCSAENPVSPASVAGLQPGDKIISLDGKPVEKFSDIGAILAPLRGQGDAPQIEIRFLRDGKEQLAQITPVLYQGAYRLGISGSIERVQGSFPDVLTHTYNASKQTLGILFALPQKVWQTAESLVTGKERQADSVISIVGITRLAGEVTAVTPQSNSGWTVSAWDRFAALLSLWSSLNLALFIFNMIPLPPLDGGHIAGALYEGGRRQLYRLMGRPDPGPADTARLVPLAQVMVMLLVGMSFVLILADIVNPISLR